MPSQTPPSGAQNPTDPFTAFGGHAVDANGFQIVQPPPSGFVIQKGGGNPVDAAVRGADPYAKYAVSGPGAASPQTDANGFQIVQPPPGFVVQNDPFAKYAVSGPGADPFAAYGGRAVGGGGFPENGQAEDPNAPWYKKVWDFANEPLLKPESVEHFLGMDPNAPGIGSGVARGAINFATGLTSPLSLLLTLGTFGAGGAVESLGASALREAGLGAAEIADATKGASVLSKALSNGHTLEGAFDAVDAAGINSTKLKSALETLKDSGVSQDALTSDNVFRRVAGHALRSAGLDIGKADSYAKYVAAGVTAGFTAQQLQAAAVASPRVLDAIKDGDYSDAAQLATEALASGVLGYAGARSFIHEAGSLVPEAEASFGLRVKPTEENRKLTTEFGRYDADTTKAARDSELWANKTRKDYSDITSDPVRLHRIKNLVEAGGDTDVLTDRFNSIALAAGRNEQIPKVSEVIGVGEPAQTADDEAGMSKARIAQLVAEQRIKAKYTPQEINNLLASYDAREIQPEDYELAKIIQGRHDETLTAAQQASALRDGVENYTTNLWQEDNPALARLRTDLRSNGSFQVNTSMARSRAFANSFEGQLAGFKLRDEALDPIQTAAYNSAQFAKVIAARQTLANIQDKNFRASDGRPMIVPSGTGRLLTDQDGNSVATLVNPNQVRSIRIAQPIVDGLRSSGQLQRMVDEGKIAELDQKGRADRLQELLTKSGKQPLTSEEQDWVNDVRGITGEPKKVYAWRPSDYKALDHPAMRDWNYAALDSSGNPISVLSDLRVHPEAVDYLTRRLGLDESPVRRSPIGRAALGTAHELKGTLLSLSPFHAVQTAGRALMAGVSPIMKLDSWDLSDPVLYKGVQHGLTLPSGSDLQNFEDGSLSSHSKLISKIPVIGRWQDSLNTWLFHDYIPSLKAKTFPAVLDRFRKANPEWTEDKVQDEAASYTNDLYGGQNLRRLGATAASQDFQKLFLLAPDWLRSELNLAARLFRPGQTVAQQDAIRMAAGVWVAARLGNMLLNGGQMHLETPFGVTTTDREGKQRVYSVRTLPTDLLHMVQDPRNFALNRLSPLAKTGLEGLTGRDEFGRKIPAPTFFANLFANSLPISAQNIGKALAGETPDVTNTDQVLKALGATVYNYKSEAGKLADQLASDRAPSGIVADPAQIRYRQAIVHLEDELRAGELTMPDLGSAVASGALSLEDYKRILEDYKQTHDMALPTARLYVRSSHLPIRDFLRVWSVATPSERVSLMKILFRKRAEYLKTVPAAKRVTDPIARQLAVIYGQPQ
jgi:hypothetical protein